MIRTLRILAFSGLALIGVNFVFYFWEYATDFGRASGVALSLGQAVLLRLLLAIASQTAFYIIFATGVVAVVASVQQRRPGWAAVLIVLLVAQCYSAPFISALVPYIAPLRILLIGALPSMTFIAQLFVPTVLAAVVLIYTFTQQPAPRDTPVGEPIGG